MKKIFSILLSLFMLVGVVPITEAVGDISVYNDKMVLDEGQEFALNSAPFFYKTDREYLYIPIEDAAKAFGFNLGWDSERNAEICISNGKTFYMYTNKNEVEVNSEMLWFDGPSIVKDNVFYINDEVIEYISGKRIKAAENIKKYGIVTVIAKSKTAFINGRQFTFEAEPYTYSSKLFVPIDSVFKSMGYTMGWDGKTSTVICYRDGVYSYINTLDSNVKTGNTQKTYEFAPMYIKGVMYVSADVFTDITGYEVLPYGMPRAFGNRDTLDGSVRNDVYRLGGTNVLRGGGVTVVDGFGMELVSASESDAKKYAATITSVAESIPDVNVYNIVVPTAAEFYAPLGMYPNQLSATRAVYENLGENVMPINVYDTLSEHAGEKIYFKTDHHWTQRGAYYAYKEFIEHKGGTIDDLSSFTNVPSYNFVGSFASFAKGTAAGNVMKNSPELLERFLPKYATVGTVFSDCAAKNKSYTVNAVNTSMNSYSSFIGGDGPVTVFYTDAPSDESVVIIKESFGNAFATWAMHNYKKVCVVDPRKFNGFGGNNNVFNLRNFCDMMDIDDVVFINYPVVVSSSGIRQAILNMK